jgi:putative tryptophan/tyrosine transport system substrate-binding protein
MRRRAFLQAAGGAAIAWPMLALAQKDEKLPLLAILIPTSEESAASRLAAIRDGLKSEGLIEGSHYAVVVRFAGGDPSRLPELARELDALRPRLFVASANAAAVIHQQLPDRPLVFTAVAIDPIAFGFAQSYAKPGGSSTGNVMNAVGGEETITAKRLGFFRNLVPNINRLGMIGVTEIPGVQRGLLSKQEEAALQTVSAQLGLRFQNYPIRTIDDLEAALSKALADGIEAFYISGDPLLGTNLTRVMPKIMATGKPTMGAYPEWGRAGLLLSYATDLADGFYRAGIYAAKIILGAKPGDLPIEQATKFSLVINTNTAKQLGIWVPPTLLALADEVIE